MNRECSVVRDLLPLYLEQMVHAETEDFVKEHLAACPGCAAELAALKAGTKAEIAGRELREARDVQAANSMRSACKKFRRRASRTAAAMAAVFLLLCMLLHFFPVYRLLDIGPMTLGGYYSSDEIAMALSIGSLADRREALPVLRLADQAFSDAGHSRAENEMAYGPLARYAASTDSYPDAAFSEHSLELWSAHLEGEEGWIWVCYSSKTYDQEGGILRANGRAQALWHVARDSSGQWIVTQIREHA